MAAHGPGLFEGSRDRLPKLALKNLHESWRNHVLGRTATPEYGLKPLPYTDVSLRLMAKNRDLLEEKGSEMAREGVFACVARIVWQLHRRQSPHSGRPRIVADSGTGS